MNVKTAFFVNLIYACFYILMGCPIINLFDAFAVGHRGSPFDIEVAETKKKLLFPTTVRLGLRRCRGFGPRQHYLWGFDNAEARSEASFGGSIEVVPYIALLLGVFFK